MTIRTRIFSVDGAPDVFACLEVAPDALAIFPVFSAKRALQMSLLGKDDPVVNDDDERADYEQNGIQCAQNRSQERRVNAQIHRVSADTEQPVH